MLEHNWLQIGVRSCESGNEYGGEDVRYHTAEGVIDHDEDLTETQGIRKK